MSAQLIVATFDSGAISTFISAQRAGAFDPDPIVERGVIYAYDDAGNVLLTIGSGPRSNLFMPHAVAVNSSGRILVTGNLWRRSEWNGNQLVFYPERTGFRQYTQDGSLMQEVLKPNNTTFWSTIAVTAAGKIVVAGTPDSDGNTLHQYHADGTLDWSVATGQTDDPFSVWVNGNLFFTVTYYSMNYDRYFGLVVVDSEDNIIVTSTINTYPRGAVKKYSSAGELQWTFLMHGEPGGIALDSSDNIYVGCAGTTDAGYPDLTLHTLKISPAGALIAAATTPFVVSGQPWPVIDRLIVSGSDLHVFSLHGNYHYIRYNLDLIEQFSDNTQSDNTHFKTAVALGDGGRYYRLHDNPPVGFGTLANTVRSQSSVTSETGAWSAIPDNSDAIPRNIAVRNVEIPSLRIALQPSSQSLRNHVTWQGDLYVVAPALPLSLAVRAPVWLLEPARAGVLQLTYRVSVLGDPRLFLPLRSFSARWTETGLALSVVCRGLTLAQVETLAARVGEPLVLDSAYRLGGDPVTSQWIEFLRVDFETIRGSFGGNSASSILEGNAEYVADGGRTRIARGVSFRTGGAQRRVRCAPDTYLRPGDVLQDGAETWTAGDITLAVSATNATMEVLERGA